MVKVQDGGTLLAEFAADVTELLIKKEIAVQVAILVIYSYI